MSSDGNKKAPWYANPMFWGVAGTVVLFAIYGRLAFVVDCDPTGLVCHSKWAQFVGAAPNEIGDTLAGLAGALAFLWIIVTVMLQSQELGEQRAEMKLQRVEFEKMVEAQEAQVKALQAQAEIFKDEKRHRQEQVAKNELDQLLEGVRICAAKAHLGCVWMYSKMVTTNFLSGEANKSTGSLRLFGNDTELGRDEFVLDCSSSLAESFRKIRLLEKQITEKSANIELLIEMGEVCEEVEKMESKLGSDQIIRLKNLDIDKLKNTIRQMIDAKIWAGD